MEIDLCSPGNSECEICLQCVVQVYDPDLKSQRKLPASANANPREPGEPRPWGVAVATFTLVSARHQLSELSGVSGTQIPVYWRSLKQRKFIFAIWLLRRHLMTHKDLTERVKNYFITDLMISWALIVFSWSGTVFHRLWNSLDCTLNKFSPALSISRCLDRF